MNSTHFKHLFLLLVFLCNTCTVATGARTGRARADSLQARVLQTDDIASKVSLYLAISREMEKYNSDSTQLYWKEAQNLAQRIKDEKPLADVYSQGAFFALRQNQLDLAFLNFTLAAKYYRNSGDKPAFARSKAMLGNICLVRDNVADALSYYMEVIEFSEQNNITGMLPHVLNNVGNIYMDAEDMTAALEYYNKALKMFQKIRDSVNVVYPLINLAEAYYHMGNPEQSKHYLRESEKVARRTGDNIVLARIEMLWGMNCTAEKKIDEAIRHYNISLDLFNQHAVVHPGPANIQYSEVLAKLGDAWFQKGDITKSLMYNRTGFSVAGSMRQHRQLMITAGQISKVYEALGRYDSSLYYHKIFSARSDSLKKSGTVRAEKLLEVRNEYEKRQKANELNMELARSAKRTLLIIYTSGGAGLLAIIIILFLMLKIEKQKKRQAETDKQNLHEKLDFQNKELTTNVMYLTRMNELVLALAEKLKKLDLPVDSENARVIQSIVSELERASGTDNWKEFEIRFQQVHTDFYRKLGDQFPDLTPNELKLCAFLRLNMSTKEISSITFQSQNSIMVARSRLRQKLGIPKDENLVTFLTQL